MKYGWPGNVRELENVIERAVILCQDDTIGVDDLAVMLSPKPVFESSCNTSSQGIHAGSAISLAEMQRAHVKGVLNSVNWNKELAAKILGISVKTLYSKVQAYGLVKSD
jgi:DNA-binding NtrC family response regulator